MSNDLLSTLIGNDFLKIILHLAVSVIAGGLVGLERTYNGHAAGFRTHTLVCMASALLMLVVIYQREWFPQSEVESVRIDPTRMAQGIMTGIGFLGAGVIMKEGLSIRGLTTAASIWITSAIGILAGIGFYRAVVVALILTLGILTVFRWIESRISALIYAQCSFRHNSDAPLPEKELRMLLARQGFDIVHLSYSFMKGDGKVFLYEMVIRTRQRQQFEQLFLELSKVRSINEFRISLTGD